MIVYNLIWLVIEGLKLFCIMNGFFNYRFKKSLVSLIFATVIIICVIATGIIAPDLYFANDFPLLVVPLTLAVAFALKGNYSITVSFLSYVAICGIDEMLVVIAQLIFGFNYTALPSVVYCLALETVSLIIFAILSLVVHFTVFRKHNLSSSFVKKANLPYLILFTIGEFATFYSIAPLIETVSLNGDGMAIGSALLLIISATTMIVTGFMLYYTAFQKVEYKELSEMNSRLVQSQSEYYQLVMRKETETRQFRHDVSNHLYCLEQLLKEAKTNEAITYVAELIKSNSSLSVCIKTGSFLVNAILSDIISKYPDVNFEWNGLLPENINMSNMDVCTIFSNLLQNAFRAADNSSEKTVRIDAKITNTSLYLIIKNSKSNEVKIKDGVLQTTKKGGRNHGFGMINAINCVEKNNGTLDYSFDNSTFTTEIILPNFAK